MDFLFPTGKHTSAKWKVRLLFLCCIILYARSSVLYVLSAYSMRLCAVTVVADIHSSLVCVLLLFVKSKSINAQQVIFDQPYNRQRSMPRIYKWSEWRSEIYPALGKVAPPEEFMKEPVITDRFSADAAANMAPHRLSAVPHPKRGNFKAPHGMAKGGLPGMPSRVKRETSTGSDISAGSTRSLNSSMSAAEVQRGIDMLVSGHGHKPLSPEDMATILSNSLSLMGDDDADSVIEDERMMRDYISDNVSELSNFSGASAQQYMEMKRSLDEKNAKKNETYRTEYESKERKDVLDNDEDGVQIFRKSYREWKPKPHAPSHVTPAEKTGTPEKR